MAGLLETLQGIDLGRLNGHLTVAGGTVSGSLALQLPDPRDLLGDLGTLLRDPDLLPAGSGDLGSLFSKGVAELGRLAPAGHLELAGEVGADLERIAALVRRLVAELGDGKALVDRLLTETGGIDGLLAELTGRLTSLVNLDLPPAAAAPAAALRKLAGGAPTEAGELAGLLAAVGIGVDLARLEAPTAELEGFLRRLRGLGGDFGPLEAEFGRLTVEVQAVVTLLAAPEPDVRAAVAALDRVRGSLDLLIGSTVPGALARLDADLASVLPEELWRPLEAKLRALLDALPEIDFDLAETLLVPMRLMAEQIALLTPEALAAFFDELRAGLDGLAADAHLERIPVVIAGLFDALVEQMRAVPLARLRDRLIEALDELEVKIREFAGFAPVWLLGDRMSDLAAKVEGLDLSAIQQQIGELEAQLQGAVDAFPIAAIKAELDGLVGTVAGVIDEARPALEGLGKELDALAGQVRSFDFEAGADASVDLMAGIRAKVREVVGSGDVPEPARAAIGLAAQGLKQVNFSAEVTAPAVQVLGQLDPAVILAPLEPVMAKIREVLEAVTPKAVVRRLEEPYSQLVGAVSLIKPDLLAAGLSAEFGRVTALLDQLDPRTLAAPLEKEFDKLAQLLRKAIDPAPLFAPLRRAYAELQGLLDQLDLEKMLGGILGRVAELPGSFGSSVGEAMKAHTGAVAEVPAAGGGPFRFGDALRPFALLLAQVRHVTGSLAGDLLGEALGRLEGAAAGLRRMTDPEAGLAGQISLAVAGRRARLDLAAALGPTAELRAALAELSITAAGASLSVSARAELGGAVAAVQLEGRFDLAPVLAPVFAPVPGTAGVDLVLERLSSGIDASPLTATLTRLAGRLETLLPDSLLAAGDTPAAARLTAFFDAFDLMPAVEELDRLGEQVQAKLQGMIEVGLRGLMGVLNRIFEILDPLTPGGLIAQIQAGMTKVKAELAVLDPAPIEAEVRDLADALLEVLTAFSPQAVAAQLAVVFDAAKAKLAALDPATLLGDLDPLANVVAGLEELRPSKVLAPLVQSTEGLEKALTQLTSLALGEALVAAVIEVKGKLEVTVGRLQGELDGLLDDLSSEGSVDVSASVSVG